MCSPIACSGSARVQTAIALNVCNNVCQYVCAGAPRVSDEVLDHLHQALVHVLEHRPPNPLVHVAACFETIAHPSKGIRSAAREIGIASHGASKKFKSQVAQAYSHILSDSTGPQEGLVPCSKVKALLHLITDSNELHSDTKTMLPSTLDAHVSFPLFFGLVSTALQHAKVSAKACVEMQKPCTCDKGTGKSSELSKNTTGLRDAWEGRIVLPPRQLASAECSLL
jgi:hypothetical protein